MFVARLRESYGGLVVGEEGEGIVPVLRCKARFPRAGQRQECSLERVMS